MKIAEKILARASDQEKVEPGDYIIAKIDLAMVHELLAGVVEKLSESRSRSVWDPSKIVSLFDHWVPAHSERDAYLHMIGREFVEKHGIENFYDMQEGICHQALPEKGHVIPGDLIVGTDSHSTTYGAFGAAGTGIGTTEMAYVFSEGKLWFRVPETININLDGKLPEGTTSKDSILKVAGELGTKVARYKSIEYSGSAVDKMSIASRMVLSNMAVELGAKFGFCPVDEKVIEYVEGRSGRKAEKIESDHDYEESYDFDLGSLSPKVACPHSVDNVKDVGRLEGTEIDQFFLGSCTNGRYEDMEMASQILGGNQVKKRTIVSPASTEIYGRMIDSGLVEVFLEAGCVVTNPTCGACMGSMGAIAQGERCLASTNRNFKGRMGSEGGEIYLASPLTVAASAVEGEITDPRDFG